MNDQMARLGVSITDINFTLISFVFREQTTSDFGIDAHVELKKNDKATGQLLGIQIKSGDSYLSKPVGDEGYAVRFDEKHINYWINHALPVLVCLCDVDNKVVYWEIVNDKTAISTGKGYKIIVPKIQTVSSSCFDTLCSFLTPFVAAEHYTIFNTDDTSNGVSKRYSIKVVLNNNMSKSEIASVIHQVTNQARQSKYHKNEIAKKQWENSNAHVVFTFVYLSAEDHRQNIYIARSIWISESLAAEYRPDGFGGENIGENIIVDWNINHANCSKFFAENKISKEQYLPNAIFYIDELKDILKLIDGKLKILHENNISEENFLSFTEKARTRINELNNEIIDLPLAPYECREISEKLNNFIALIHNIYLFYSDKGLKTWDAENRLRQSLKKVLLAHKEMQFLEYEISKVR